MNGGFGGEGLRLGEGEGHGWGKELRGVMIGRHIAFCVVGEGGFQRPFLLSFLVSFYI